MTKQELKDLFNDYLTKYEGIAAILIRICAYSLAFLICAWASMAFFSGRDAATLSLLIVSSVVIELLSDSRQHGARFWWYAFSILGLVACSVFLVRESIHSRELSTDAKSVSKRFSSMLAEAPGEVLANDVDGNILSVSSGILRLTGYDRDEVIGRPLQILMDDNDAKMCIAYFQESSRKMRQSDDPGWVIRTSQTVRFATKNGGFKSVNIQVFGLRHGSKTLIEDDIQFISVVVAPGP